MRRQGDHVRAGLSSSAPFPITLGAHRQLPMGAR